MRREWTSLEEIECCTLAWIGVKWLVIARRLNRPASSVRSKLNDLGFSEPSLYGKGGLARKVKTWHARGLNDKEISLKLGVRVQSVFATRKRLALPANITASEAGKRSGKMRELRENAIECGIVRCIGCDRPCPTGTFTAKSGWYARPIPGYEEDQEYHCPSCFRKYGFGDPQRATA